MPERKRATVDFWDRLADYEVAISELTLAEIRVTADPPLRQEMEALVCGFEVLPTGVESRRLSQEYLRRGVFSPATVDDAPSTWRSRLCPGGTSS